MRIVSLLPSATEIVYALGLGDQLVGVSHECDFPTQATRLPSVTASLIPATASSGEIDRMVRERTGGRQPLYRLDVAALEELRPDLIITQGLCNVCAVAVVQELELRASEVAARPARSSRTPKVVFIEWLDPPFSCGHWNPELVRMAGGIESLGRAGEPARTITWSDVEAVQPEVIFIACCGFGVERTLADLPALTRMSGWRDLPAIRANRVYVTDGNQYFSRPGPRIIDSLEILAHALDPELHPLRPGIPQATRVDVGDLVAV
jgi:iron complex transport system substrate-binding protein